MQVQSASKPQDFKPIVLSITIESRAEMLALEEILNIALHRAIVENRTSRRSLIIDICNLVQPHVKPV